MGNESNYFNLHMVSDSTGETLMTVARATTAQYSNIAPVEHVYPLIRQDRQLEKVIADIEAAPGIVLYTLVESTFAQRLEKACKHIQVPCVNILDPVHQTLKSYLNVRATWRVGGQYVLDDHYFQRMEALNYTMMHDDGQLADDLEEADVVLVGISRTSKTPTCIYLANRGFKAANVPLVPDIDPPRSLKRLRNPVVVGLLASAERIRDIRQNRILSASPGERNERYVDRKLIAQEIAMCKRLCKENGWTMIDVTRKSIEESATEIIEVMRKTRIERGLSPLP
ncbi:pyruvate, water dikinase regulatory protein [Polycladidibacter hongkongensis]|uniref:pyruvate, water dikinase regulatory protein n=1 Tax=Polycladidibacter hongkongensis TaxID=1647556 RepID=UPI0009EBF3F9|nr:pyruvate, water dikinase regulatory protein [Pseudovibrio hongkongensis]